ncbi:MAG: CapA family protein [Acidimicrobiales bacterium]
MRVGRPGRPCTLDRVDPDIRLGLDNGPVGAPTETTKGASPSASTTTTTSTTTTATAGTAHPVSLLFAGDVLIHGPVADAARRPDGSYDFAPLFAPVAGIVSAADVAVCHMEIPIDDDDDDISSYPLFYAPRRLADGLAETGFDGCSTASNHSLDQGGEGVDTTLAVLDAAGLKHAGTGRSQAEAVRPAVYEVDGIRIAHLSYSYDTNGQPFPPGAPWAVNLIDPAQVIADARAAREAGAEVVVASLHWGLEYNQKATGEQEVIAQAVMASDAVDLVVGHHAHVPQGIRKVAGRWVVFGLGNFVSNQSAACCHPAAQDGVVVRVDLAFPPGAPKAGRAAVRRVVFTPVRMDRSGYRVVPVAEALRTPSLAGGLGPDELRTSFLRTVAVVAATPDPLLQPSANLP